jgi:hypothetical protein
MSTAPRVHLQTAWDIVEGLSTPSKMPCYSYNIPAKYCKIGTLLRNIKGSTCEWCYAYERGRYGFRPVQDALERRFKALDDPRWANAMSELINGFSDKYSDFRWHDSGDIQSVDHLNNIVKVARLTPTVNHWLPTREYKIVSDYRKQFGEFPTNLVVRLSGHMVDQAPPIGYGLPVSSVTTKPTMPGAVKCEAKSRGGKCGPCRACWNPKVMHVAYPIHYQEIRKNERGE